MPSSSLPGTIVDRDGRTNDVMADSIRKLAHYVGSVVQGYGIDADRWWFTTRRDTPFRYEREDNQSAVGCAARGHTRRPDRQSASEADSVRREGMTMPDTKHNTVFLRLEGPLQSWGTSSRFVVRDTGDEPSKSGVLGLICGAMGQSRGQADDKLADLRRLRMGVRVDRPGVVWTDYHTAGAKIGLMKAAGGIKHTESTDEIEAVLSRRDYLCDASFLVALMGSPATVAEVADGAAIAGVAPVLGQQVLPAVGPGLCGRRRATPTLAAALSSVPWRPRLPDADEPPDHGSRGHRTAGIRNHTPAGRGAADGPATIFPSAGSRSPVRRPDDAIACPTVRRSRNRGLSNATTGRTIVRRNGVNETRPQRLEHDQYLCVFCKQPADQVHHIDYTRAGNENLVDLRSLCKLCHDAITMLEYGREFGQQRIDPCLPAWREAILAKRAEILGERIPRPRRFEEGLTMYLSQLVVNVGGNPNRLRPGLNWIRNPYRVHQRLAMAFPSPAQLAADPFFIEPFSERTVFRRRKREQTCPRQT